MPRLFDFDNPVSIAILAVVGLLVAGLVLLLLARSSRRKLAREAELRDERLALERDWQFSEAIERLKFDADPQALGQQIAALLREYAGLTVMAIYAYRDDDEHADDLLHSVHSESGVVESGQIPFPTSIPKQLILGFKRPQIVNSSVLVNASNEAHGPDSETSQELEPSSSEPLIESRLRYFQTTVPERLAILPWFGSLGWSGIIVIRANESLNSEMMVRKQELIARLGERLAVALELVKRRTEFDEKRQRADRAAAFYRSLLEIPDDHSPLVPLAKGIAELIKVSSAAIWRLDERGSMLRMVAEHGLGDDFLPLPLGQGLTGSVAQSGKLVAVEDAPSDPRCLFPREARESGIGSYLGVPVMIDDRVVAVLEVHRPERHVWDADEVRSLELASSAAAEILKSTDARGNRLRVENSYLGLSEAMQRLRSREEVQEAVVEVLGHALGVSRAMIIEIDENGQPASAKQEYVNSSVGVGAGPLSGDVLARVASAVSNGEPMPIPDSKARSLMGAATAADLGVLSELAVPVRVQGRINSIVYLHQCDQPREWQRDEIEFAARVSRQLSLSLSSLSRLDEAARDAAQAAAHIAELERRLQRLDRRLPDLEKTLSEARKGEEQARKQLAAAQASEAEARTAADALVRSETELRAERDQLREDESRVRRSAQQLLEINRLKSDFIVNAGRELESSLQSLIGFIEQLSQGIYGPVNDEQFQALKNVYSWAMRLKTDIDWLIDYGSTRSRRLETTNEASAAGT